MTTVTLPGFRRYFPAGSVSPRALRALAELEGGSARPALEAIRRHPGLTLTELARRLGVSPAAAHKTVARLSKAGLVGKHRDGRRVRLLAIDRGGGLSPDGRLRKPREPPSRRAPPSSLGRAAPAGAALRDRRLKAWAERRARELGFDDVTLYLLHLIERDRRRARAGDAPRQGPGRAPRRAPSTQASHPGVSTWRRAGRGWGRIPRSS